MLTIQMAQLPCDNRQKQGGQMQTTQLAMESDVNQTQTNESHTVDIKYMGTAADQHDMMTLGRKQVLRRNFHFISILGFGAVLICSWEIIFANLIFSLTDGGTAGLFWGYTVTVIASVFIYLSISEMASMSPTAGGQYHWVSEFAPRSCQKFLSYITGYILATGWQVSIVALSFAAGTMIQGLLVLNVPSYTPQRWHGTLLVIACASFAIVFNSSLAKGLPLLETLVLILHIVGIIAIIVPLLVLAPYKNSADVALLVFYDGGKWSTMGTSVMVGLLTPLGTIMGYDCCVHMSEEIQDASGTLPKAIMSAVGLNAILGYVAVLTLCFTIDDTSSIINSSTGYPFIQHCYNVTQSYAATNVMVSIVIIALVAAVISEVATASRQIWSFARDNGLPFSYFLKRVSPGWNIPLNAVWICLGATVLLSLLNLGSTVALNAISSLAMVALLSSYMLSIGCILSKRLHRERLPPARWSLGRWGIACNIISLIFLIAFFIFAFFPLATPVTPPTMNWAFVMFVGIITFASIYYVIYGRHIYIPPVVLTKRDY